MWASTAAPTASSTGMWDFAAAAEKAAFLTPVPGGVGPMTRAMLMKNTRPGSRPPERPGLSVKARGKAASRRPADRMQYRCARGTALRTASCIFSYKKGSAGMFRRSLFAHGQRRDSIVGRAPERTRSRAGQTIPLRRSSRCGTPQRRWARSIGFPAAPRWPRHSGQAGRCRPFLPASPASARFCG